MVSDQTLALGTAISHLDERNALAEETIRRYARSHARSDALTGFAGGLIPGGFVVALVWQLERQFRHLYPAMTKELAAIYNATPDDWTKRVAGRSTFTEGAAETLVQVLVGQVAIQVGGELATQMGPDLLHEIAWDVAREGAPGAAGSFVPVIGAGVGAISDVIIAVLMTWRVGAIVSVYFQNGGQYVGGSRKATYDTVKRTIARMPGISKEDVKATGKEFQRISRLPTGQRVSAFRSFQPELERMAQTRRPAALQQARSQIPEVQHRLVDYTVQRIHTLMRVTTDREKIKDILTSKEGPGAEDIPEDIVDLALRRVSGLTN